MSNLPEFVRDLAVVLHQIKVDPENEGRKVQLAAPMYLIGNGGSFAIAQHICNDIIKTKKVPAMVPDAATLACLANDYGWEHVYARWLEAVFRDGTLIAISSSGRSQNIINACRYVMDRGEGSVITLTGFDEINPIRQLGDVNFYVPSSNYGIVEICHLSILHGLTNPGTCGGPAKRHA